MTILDVAIVTVAIPSIQSDLHIAESTVQWTLTAYAITFGGFLLLGRPRRLRCGGRRLARRNPDQVPRLAVDLLRQRACRGDRARAHAPDRAREPRRPRPPALRRNRRRHRHLRPRAARVRDLEGA